jgi:intracellular septation protein
MKLLFEFLPILLFFIAYKQWDIYVATAVAMGASLVQVAWVRVREQRWDKMLLVSMALILALGGATLLLHDDRFILWKPTAVNWLFALVFLGSQFVGKRPLIRVLMEKGIALPDAIWGRLNLAWVGFFLLSGAVNLYVAFHFSRDTWVNFKLYGLMGMTIAFVILQAFWLHRYLPKQPSAE